MSDTDTTTLRIPSAHVETIIRVWDLDAALALTSGTRGTMWSRMDRSEYTLYNLFPWHRSPQGHDYWASTNHSIGGQTEG